MNFRYSLTRAPEARKDGSGYVDHDIQVEVDKGEGWEVLPGRHKTISVSHEEISNALSQATTQLKVAAYKEALRYNINTVPEPVTGWDLVGLETLVTENDLAAVEASAADSFVVVTLGRSYPVEFQL